ncbi:hypothetical protein PDJAM_G00167020 [Pangasius djambal]|uniref:Uncharacterized protein n=1 Tax=Pangasius djambal TaxID=1691987 RepID=A0ACC5ZKQ8_9TELE|nr:hypothetical protein [Pangasius djambal]
MQTPRTQGRGGIQTHSPGASHLIRYCPLISNKNKQGDLESAGCREEEWPFCDCSCPCDHCSSNWRLKHNVAVVEVFGVQSWTALGPSTVR